MRSPVHLLSLAMLASACPSEGADLLVDVKTDLVPGEEFVAIRVTTFDDDAARVREGEVFAPRGTDSIRGVRALEASGLAAGNYRVQVSLIDAGGRVVAARTSAARVQATTAVTILLPRDTTRCDPATCEPGTTCRGLRCVAETCRPGNRRRVHRRSAVARPSAQRATRAPRRHA